MDDASGNPSRSSGTVRRTALLLVGGAAGVLVGFILLTALARPASAAPLPSTVIPSATTVLGSPDIPGSSSLPTVPALTGTVTAAADAVAPAVAPAASPLSLTSIRPVAQGLSGDLQTLSGAVSSTVSTLPILPVLGSARSTTVPAVGSAPDGAVHGVVMAATGQPLADTAGLSRTAAGFALSGFGPAHSPSAPVVPPTSPTPLPTPSAPLQNTPLTANDAPGSPAGSGGGLFGSAPLASLLPPMSSIGGVRPVREKVPQLLLASRCTPPG
jgi:hypothetical protein